MKTVSSQQFNRDVAAAKRAAARAPVFITDRGEPGWVLLSIEQFRTLTLNEKSGLGVVRSIGAQFKRGDLDFNWTPPRVLTKVARSADLD